MNFNIGYTVILPCLRLSPQHMCKYVFKHPFRQDISKQTYLNFVFIDYILTLALYTVQCTYASLNTGGMKSIS